MPLFVKKPVIVEARQYDGSLEGVNDLITWIEKFGGETHRTCLITGPPDGRGLGAHEKHEFTVETLEGSMTVSPGDWVIKGVRDEFYPCKPDIFEQTYTPHILERSEATEERPWDLSI